MGEFDWRNGNDVMYAAILVLLVGAFAWSVTREVRTRRQHREDMRRFWGPRPFGHWRAGLDPHHPVEAPSVGADVSEDGRGSDVDSDYERTEADDWHEVRPPWDREQYERMLGRGGEDLPDPGEEHR